MHIIISFKETALNISEIAKINLDTMLKVSAFMDHYTWYFSDRKKIDLTDEAMALNEILRRIKTQVRTGTTIRKVPDDYVDTTPCGLSFFYSEKITDDFEVTFYLGMDFISNNNRVYFFNIENALFFDNEKNTLKMIDFCIGKFDPDEVAVYNSEINDELNLEEEDIKLGWMVYLKDISRFPQNTDLIHPKTYLQGGAIFINKYFFCNDDPIYLQNCWLVAELFKANNLKRILNTRKKPPQKDFFSNFED